MLPEWTYTPEARRQLAAARRPGAASMDEETTHEFDALNTLLLVVILGTNLCAHVSARKSLLGGGKRVHIGHSCHAPAPF